MNNSKIQKYNGFLFENFYVIGSFYGIRDKLTNFSKKELDRIDQDVVNYNRKEFRKYKKNIKLFNERLISLNQGKYEKFSLKEIFLDIYLKELEKEDLNQTILSENIDYVMLIGFLNGYYNIIKNTNLKLTQNKIININYNLNAFYQEIKNISIEAADNLEERDSIIKKFIIEEDKQIYLSKGEFLNSDFLIHLKDKKDNDFVFVSELNFKNNLLLNNNINEKEIINDMSSLYLNILKGIYSKNIIQNLKINEEKSLKDIKSGIFNDRIIEFLPLLNELVQNNDHIKKYQGLNYIYSYLKYLKNKGYKKQINIKLFQINNFDINTINIKQTKNKSIDDQLSYFVDIPNLYKNINNDNNLYTKYDNIIEENNQSFKDLDSYFEKSFDINKKFQLNIDQYSQNNFNNFLNEENIKSNKLYNITLNKIIDVQKEGNITTLSLREEHTKKFIKELMDKEILLAFGSPGIGKTTSVVGYLTQLDNYVCLYSSSRTSVNLDILKKVFKDSSNIFNNEEKQKFYEINKYNQIEFEKNNICFEVNKNSIETNQYKFCFKDDNLNDTLISLKRPYINVINENKNTNLNQNKTSNNIEDFDKKTSVYKNAKDETVFNCVSSIINGLINEVKVNKVLGTFALQGYKSEDMELYSLFSFIKTMITNKNNKINNLIIMLDEITGSSSSYGFIDKIMNFFYLKQRNDYFELKRKITFGNEFIEIPENFNFKFIIADASLSNKEVGIHYFNKNFKLEKPSISTSLCENKKEEKVYLDYFNKNELRDSILNIDINKISILNVNCYPAKFINLEYIFNINKIAKTKIKDTSYAFAENENFNTIQNKTEEWLKENKNKDKKLLIFLQNKNQIDKLQPILKKLFDINNICCLHSNTIKDVENIDELIELNKIILATSTVSRGISFPKVNHIITIVPTFDFENQLNEIIQVIYRQRGNPFFDENDTKNLTFVISDKFPTHSNEKSKLNKYHNALYMFNILFLIESIIYTRFKGYYKFKLGTANNKLQIVPLSSKGLSSMNSDNQIESNFYDNLTELDRIGIDVKSEQIVSNYLKKHTNLSIEYMNETIKKLKSTFSKLTNRNNYMEYLETTEIISQNGKSFFSENDISFDGLNLGIKSKVDINLKIDQIDIKSNEYKEFIENFEIVKKNIKKLNNKRYDNIFNKLEEFINKGILTKTEYFNKIENNRENIDKYYIVPIYNICLLTNKQIKKSYTYDKEIELLNKSKNQSVFNTIMYLKQFMDKSYNSQMNKAFPKNNVTEFIDDLQFILVSDDYFERYLRDTYSNTNLSNHNLMNFFNLMFIDTKD